MEEPTDDSGIDVAGATEDYERNISIKEEPELATTSSLDTDGYCDYDLPKNESQIEFVDVNYQRIKEEPEPELCGSDGDAGVDGAPSIDVNSNSYCDYGPCKKEPKQELAATDGGSRDGSGGYVPNVYCDSHKKEPELKLATTGDAVVTDDGRDVGDDCSYCGVNLCTQEFKVEHELRCKVQMQRRELESQVAEVYHCGYCRCPFLSKEYKEQHQQKWCRKRPVPARKDFKGTYFECDKCEYITKWKQNLETHVLKHDKINAEWFTCTQCSYKTVHKQSMTRHTRIHGNAFSCCCPICGKSFRVKLCLDDHLLCHHADELDEVSKLITSKIYTCDICNQYRTTSKANFNEHVAVTHHKGIGCQKYQCPSCSYNTFRKANLKTHSKTHAEQKDYQCTVCKKQFTRKRGFDSHVLSCHADNADLVKTITAKIHRCELCSFKTLLMTHLSRHVESKHS